MADAVLTQAIETLRNNHVRVTPQRKMIIQYLVTHTTHPTVEILFKELYQQEPNLSMATVYNTLHLLVSLGIVVELSNESGAVRYDYYGHSKFYAICANCGKIIDIFYKDYGEIEANFTQAAKRQADFQATTVHVEVHGLCAECQKMMLTQ